ncbi:MULTISPECIES: RNA polymerase sigma factor [Gammaproteobacteria]|jgi:RNA polymerase sigma-70 factor (ECF subfamily)|uniref:RNA polymerase sigma factor n=1 Tax=Gammaproteobacteria TaxID=1236 RepID=UPI00112CEDD9|nr:sigma-70 family RNA polymerase sigma factor [Pseudomonas sp. Hp2]
MADGMADTADLRDYLLGAYDDLRGRLARRLGCTEQASDALQDVWLRLATRPEQRGLEAVRNPRAYLLRMAFNVMVDRQRADSRLLNAEEIDSLLNLADPNPGPAQSTEERLELEALAGIIERMPARRRQILLSVRVEGMQQRDVAERLGVSLRLVQRELKAAQEYIAARLGI